MKIGSIKGSEGKNIVISTGLDGEGKRILKTSCGDAVHPHSLPYKRGAAGTAQAILDTESMWGRDWGLDLVIDIRDYAAEGFKSGDGYVCNQ